MKITLDRSKSVEENAADYYSKARKFKEKAEGARNALKETEKEIAREEKRESYEAQKPRQEQKSKVRIKRKLEWFERYRWFFTSNGLLAIGGRDASQNEQIFSKQANPKTDLFFHADVHGASVVILKDGQVKGEKEDKLEAAQFAVAYSNAWKGGSGSTDAYCLPVEKVSKSAKSGEYVSKGGFVMSGKREWFRNLELKMRIGVDDKKIPLANPFSCKKQLMKSACIVPGQTEKGEIAKKLQKLLGTDSLDEILLLLPPGKSGILDLDKPKKP